MDGTSEAGLLCVWYMQSLTRLYQAFSVTIKQANFLQYTIAQLYNYDSISYGRLKLTAASWKRFKNIKNKTHLTRILCSSFYRVGRVKKLAVFFWKLFKRRYADVSLRRRRYDFPTRNYELPCVSAFHLHFGVAATVFVAIA